MKKNLPSHLYSMYKLQTLMDRYMDETLKKSCGITRSQYFVLLGITQETVSTQRTIAGLLGVSEVAISKQLTLLEKAGYITKAPMLWDKRSIVISITKKGVSILSIGTKKLETLFEKIFGTNQKNKVLMLDAEMKKMLHILEHFIQKN